MNMRFLNDLDEYIRGKQYRLVNNIVIYEKDDLIYKRYYNQFTEESSHPLMSVWKSILSLTCGVCIDKGLIKNADEPVYKYLPQFAQNIDYLHKMITVRHLLTMSSGIYFHAGRHYSVPMGGQLKRSHDWVSHIADIQVADLPGSRFVYKEWDVMLLSAVIGKVCGGMAWDIAEEYLYRPLGIKTRKWLVTKCGINYNIDTDNQESDELAAMDLIKFGLLMQHGGKWNGKRIVSEDYVKAAVAPSGAYKGYGFLWWLSDKGFHGRGFGGQELNVYPDKGITAVVQATATPQGKSYGDICEGIMGQ